MAVMVLSIGSLAAPPFPAAAFPPFSSAVPLPPAVTSPPSSLAVPLPPAAASPPSSSAVPLPPAASLPVLSLDTAFVDSPLYCYATVMPLLRAWPLGKKRGTLHFLTIR